MAPGGAAPERRFRIVSIGLDDASIARRGPEIDHERAVAVYDLVEANYFQPVDDAGGPYHLVLSAAEGRLILSISRYDAERNAVGAQVQAIGLSLGPFRRVIKDYFTVCDSYYAAIRQATPAQIEAIDVGRRSLHDEGSELLRERLAGKVAIDTSTARRLFTLLCALHLRI
jgi:uncharacterized protein (UPF0262 family)